MKAFTLRRTAPIIAAGALIMAAGAAVAQPQTPLPNTAPVVACPGHMTQGGMAPGMMVDQQGHMQGGHMMTMEEMQQMHADMRALHEDVAKLRAELEKRNKR